MKLHTYNKRMFELMDYAISNRINGIKTKKEFAEIIGMNNQSNMAEIKQGIASFTIAHVYSACHKLNINANWIFGTEKKMFNTIAGLTPLDRIKEAVFELESSNKRKPK